MDVPGADYMFFHGFSFVFPGPPLRAYRRLDDSRTVWICDQCLEVKMRRETGREKWAFGSIGTTLVVLLILAVAFPDRWYPALVDYAGRIGAILTIGSLGFVWCVFVFGAVARLFHRPTQEEREEIGDRIALELYKEQIEREDMAQGRIRGYTGSDLAPSIATHCWTRRSRKADRDVRSR